MVYLFWDLFILAKRDCPSMKEVLYYCFMDCSSGFWPISFLSGLFVMMAGSSRGGMVEEGCFACPEFTGWPRVPAHHSCQARIFRDMVCGVLGLILLAFLFWAGLWICDGSWEFRRWKCREFPNSLKFLLWEIIVFSWFSTLCPFPFKYWAISILGYCFFKVDLWECLQMSLLK